MGKVLDLLRVLLAEPVSIVFGFIHLPLPCPEGLCEAGPVPMNLQQIVDNAIKLPLRVHLSFAS